LIEIKYASYVLWLSGYYNGTGTNTIIEPEAMDKNEEKVDFYCNLHREMTVMDAVKNVLGLAPNAILVGLPTIFASALSVTLVSA
jgi:HdeA/HdeB family